MGTLVSLLTMAALLAVLAVVGAVVMVVAGKRYMKEIIAAESAELIAWAAGGAGDQSEWTGLADLPEPVQRYCRFALPEGRAPVQWVRLKQKGQLRQGPGQEWLPLNAEEVLTPVRPGFVWWGRVQMKPWLWVEARDKFVAGEGNMLIRLASALTWGDFVGREMDLSGLVRVLTELPWAPTALGPGGPVRWEAMDDHTARGVLTDGDLRVAAVFTFGEGGEIREVTTTDKFREEGGRLRRRPWRATLGGYRRMAGMMIPTEGEASWQLPEGECAYGRFKIVEVRFGFPEKRGVPPGGGQSEAAGDEPKKQGSAD